MKIRHLLLLTLLAVLSTAAWAEQVAEGQQQRVPTVTRLVQLFSSLESELMTAVQKGNSTAIDKMLADDFELRSGAMPGTPTPRADWLQHSRRQLSAPIEQMAVHDHGTTAIVSFLWKRGTGKDIFIVDVWSKSGDAWKLSVRYASPAGDQRFTIPGAVFEGLTIEKK